MVTTPIRILSKIISDGTPIGTFVYDDSGKKLEYVQSLNIDIDINKTLVIAQMTRLNMTEPESCIVRQICITAQEK